MDARRAWLQRLQIGCLAVIAAVVGYGYARQPPPAPTPTRPAAPPQDPGYPVFIEHAAAVPATAPTIDALLAEIVKLRKQKQEPDAREQALVKQLRDRLRDLGDKLAELGINPPEQGGAQPLNSPPPAVQPAIGIPAVNVTPAPGSPPAP